ncbi:MAG: hypothetical protein QM617_02060, partial [Comamonas sp.]
NAVKVVATMEPLTLIPGLTLDKISAVALARSGDPLAQLNIRTTLATVSTSQSILLNALVGGLLGGSIDLSVGSWQGLVDADVSLLDYLDALAIKLGVTVGDYDTLLETDVTVGQLLEVLADVASQDGVASLAVTALETITAQATLIQDVDLQLGDILGVSAAVPDSALDVSLGLFDLLSAIVQVGNGSSSVYAAIDADLLGLTGVTVRLKVTEPEQVSAIGSPRLIDESLDPEDDPNRSFVRTAQVRLLLSVELSLISDLTDLLNELLTSLSSVTTFLNDVLSLDLVDGLSSILNAVGCSGTSCREYEVTYVKLLDELDVILDLGGGQAYVDDYDCSEDDKSLTVKAKTELAKVRVGELDLSTEAKIAAAMSTSSDVELDPAPILSLGYVVGRPSLCVLLICTGWKYKTSSSTWVSSKSSANYIPQAALAVGLNSSVAQTTATHTYDDPPELDEDPSYYEFSAQDIVSSLTETLDGLTITARSYENSILGVVLDLTSAILTVAKSLLSVVISLLSTLLDPLINTLLKLLGVSLANTEVGARLSCLRGAELVY